MASKEKKIAEAKKLHADFSGHQLGDEEFVVTIADDTVIFPVGELVGIMYRCTRDGKKEKYLHQFKASSAPILAVTSDGKQFFAIGGNYQFKDSGFNDL